VRIVRGWRFVADLEREWNLYFFFFRVRGFTINGDCVGFFELSLQCTLKCRFMTGV